jgi:hypothetical protein
MEFLFITLVFGVFAVIAAGLGVDSRDLSDDRHRASYPVGID